MRRSVVRLSPSQSSEAMPAGAPGHLRAQPPPSESRRVVQPFLHAVARGYLASGLCVLPAERIGNIKRPVGSWTRYQSQLLTAAEIATKFPATVDHICIATGAISGQLEVIDFDMAGEAFEPWRGAIDLAAPGLRDRLVIESSPSGGRHVFYRCQAPVGKSVKLAQRRIDADGPGEIQVCGKSYKPRKDERGGWHVIVTTIETRGERSVCLCAPSPGYELIQGDLTEIPTITPSERDAIIRVAWELSEIKAKPVEGPRLVHEKDRPGDDFNERGDVRDVLVRAGWTLEHEGANEHWRRPGKSAGTSATLRDRVFYVFSSNAPPFEPMEAYSPFAVFALLEHGGNWSAAAAALRASGYGATARNVTISSCADEPERARYHDPGMLPIEYLRVPGFIGELMDYCLETAPYPNPTLAFSGALVAQATLAGRNVRDPADCRSNVYILSLAHSAAGKDHPRKVNARLLHAVGMSNCLADRLASGEGLQDALYQTPTMLAQTDEIDGMLQSINRARDGRFESLSATLLSMYSSSNSIVPMRKLAGLGEHRVIDQPCLVLFGTAVPNHYYAALSERMLTNGFFGRMSVFEAGARGPGQEPVIKELPSRVLDTAQWWATMSIGDRGVPHGGANVVPYSIEASSLLIDVRHEVDSMYDRAVAQGDAVAATVIGRVTEHVRKFALLYAVSENTYDPQISADAIRWARRLVTHQAHRMLFMASEHAAETPFEESVLKAIRKLREASNRTLSHSILLKRMKMKAREFQELMDTLVERGEVESTETHGGGRCGLVYRLVGSVPSDLG